MSESDSLTTLACPHGLVFTRDTCPDCYPPQVRPNHATPGVNLEESRPAKMAYCVHCHERIYCWDEYTWYHLDTQRTRCV